MSGYPVYQDFRERLEFLFERRYLASKLRYSGPDPNARIALLRRFHQRGQQFADPIVTPTPVVSTAPALAGSDVQEPWNANL